jgi:hypothetical protein
MKGALGQMGRRHGFCPVDAGLDGLLVLRSPDRPVRGRLWSGRCCADLDDLALPAGLRRASRSGLNAETERQTRGTPRSVQTVRSARVAPKPRTASRGDRHRSCQGGGASVPRVPCSLPIACRMLGPYPQGRRNPVPWPGHSAPRTLSGRCGRLPPGHRSSFPRLR